MLAAKYITNNECVKIYGILIFAHNIRQLNASVQYPMITGGTIVVSLIISIIGREKVTYKNVISAILALMATILIV